MRTEFGLKEIDVFVKVVDFGSFVKAAREYAQSRQTVAAR